MSDKPNKQYPDFGEKEAVRISTTSTFRSRKPTNAQTAAKVPNYVFDHSNQMPIWPDHRPDALIETTQKTNQSDYRTMNRSGQPFALGVQVGGSPDDKGVPFLKGKKQGMTK